MVVIFNLLSVGKVWVLAKNSLGEMCMTSPALVPNALIIRTTRALYRIGESPALARWLAPERNSL
jgi:hypothetical protein